MKSALAIALLLALGGCAAGQGSYGLESGDASYDALKAASEKCKAQGGEVRLKNGGDSRDLGDYECKVGKGS